MPTSSKTKVFFPNLDGLRFICFFMVFLFHINKTVTENYLAHGAEIPTFFKIFKILFQNGNLGVNFFFVLSGFLITFLLVKEKELTGKIHVINFYIRRILRIWPLFYLCVLIGFVIFPMAAHLLRAQREENASLIYYLLFLNNFDIIEKGFPNSLILGILWSIAIEEQFYLSWPLLLSFLPLRFFKYAAIVILAGSLAFRFFYQNDTNILYFHTLAVIGDMAIGGLFAYLSAHNNKFLHVITTLKKSQIAAIYLITIFLFIFRHKLFASSFALVFERVVISTFFGLIILEQNFSNNSFFKFSQFRTLTQLGVYTYGLYCVHFIGIYAAMALGNQFKWDEFNVVINLLQAIVALIITILLSMLSYHFFEKKFLSLKDRFALIVKN